MNVEFVIYFYEYVVFYIYHILYIFEKYCKKEFYSSDKREVYLPDRCWLLYRYYIEVVLGQIGSKKKALNCPAALLIGRNVYY